MRRGPEPGPSHHRRGRRRRDRRRAPRHPARRALLRERRQTSSASGEPVEFSDDRYRPDLVSFTIDNSQQARPALLRSPSDLLPARAPQGETP
ncbi:hypothetical protein ACFQ0B_32440 [Nonomuraea thailandensis]